MAVSSELNAQSSNKRIDNGHRGMAFLIEALVVLAFLMASLAVFVKLFTSAQLEGLGANNLSQAVILATNTAEVFSADPTGMQETVTEGDLIATCKVEEDKHNAGTLYNATITVTDGTNELYTLRTARYVSTQNGGA